MGPIAITAVCLAGGALIGFMGGMLGIGGGLVAIPALVLLLDMPQQMAQGTALIMVLPTVLFALRRYNQHTRIDRGVALAGAATAIVMTWVGARLALGIDSDTLRHSFAIFLFGIGVFYLWQTWHKRPAALARRRASVRTSPGRAAPVLTRRTGAVLGAVAGTLSGFFGVGGALIVVPITTSVFKLTQIYAQALALSMVIPGAAVALITYSWAGQVNAWVGLPLLAGSLVCVPWGVRVAYKLPEPVLRTCFAVLIFATVALLVIG